MKRREWSRAMLAGIIAAVALACGEASVELAGEMLEDAGTELMDASARLMDAGGQAMRDAGRTVRDAGKNDAMAQDPDTCGTCTVDGPLAIADPVRTILASEDPDRLVAERLIAPWANTNAAGTDVIEGPVVVVNLIGPSDINFWVGDPGCAFERVGVFGLSEGEINARVIVPAGDVLCAKADNNSYGDRNFYWSGFRPYAN